MPLVYCALGSNIEPKSSYLSRALTALKEAFPEGFGASHLYRSAPFRGLDQEAYLNAACCFKTELSPRDLLDFLLGLERQLGRLRSETKWDKRTLDLDIVFYDQLVLDEKGLTIPHYDLLNRDFFLVPLMELDPKLIDPRSGNPLSEALRVLPEELKTDLNRLD